MRLGVEGRPPKLMLLVNGMQHAVLILGIGLAMPILVLSHSGLPELQAGHLLSLSMIALALSTLLLIQARSIMGSGYLIPAVYTAAYLPPCIAAMQHGGPALVMGMLMFGGVLQMSIAPLIFRLRAYFPTEIGGLAVVMIGVTLGSLGVHMLLETQSPLLPDPPPGHLLVLGLVTLFLMAGLSVWGKGAWRYYCSLWGIALGVVTAMALGLIDWRLEIDHIVTQGFAFPQPLLHWPQFSWHLVPAFAVGALICVMRGMGDMIAAQKVEKPQWVRPDYARIRGGLLADGMGNFLAGLLGSPSGLNTSSGNVGLAAATGVTARRIGYGIAAFLVLIALLPGVAQFFLHTPRPIFGAVLVFSSALIIFNGMQVIFSRLLDARRMLTLGIPLVVGLNFDWLQLHANPVIEPVTRIFNSGLMLALVLALLLNFLFRIGITQRMEWQTSPQLLKWKDTEARLKTQGGQWGLRVDVTERALNAIHEVVEALAQSCGPQVPVTIEVAFDQVELRVRVHYQGQPLAMAGNFAMDAEELMALDERQTDERLRAAMLSKLADRVQQSTLDGGRQCLELRFDH